MASDHRRYSEEEILAGIQILSPTVRRYENALYQRYMHLIWKRPSKYGISDEQARDAYADTIVVALRQLRRGDFKGQSSLYTYLRTIFFRKCIDVSRKKTTTIYTDASATFPELPDASKDFLTKIFHREAMDTLMDTMKQLGERCQELLRFVGEGFKMKEIADQMGFASVESATSQRYQCKKRLLKLVESSKKEHFK
ncbi:MAG: sigma-70 family RNA polymerase sigma factor [Bacteroidota bacterium]